MLKSMTIDINSEVKNQNKMLDGMGGTFGSATDLFKNTINKLGVMVTSGSSKHMYYLIAFVVFVFFILYFSMGRKWVGFINVTINYIFTLHLLSYNKVFYHWTGDSFKVVITYSNIEKFFRYRQNTMLDIYSIIHDTIRFF